MGKLYTEKSIESLSPLEFTRLKPGVYCGDTTYSTQLLIEIFSNSVDEFRNGFGNIINVTIDKDIVTIEDWGQGFIPNSFREDGTSILEAAFSILNTSGKYREDGTYEGTSLGSFGIGAKLTNFLSHWLIVSTYRDGKTETISFKEGVFDKRTNESQKNKNNGTIVIWQPSEQFFTHTEVEIKKIKELFKTIACLCPGLIINLTYNDKKEVFKTKKGINDLIDEAINGNEIIKNRLIINHIEGKNKFDMVLTYSNNYSPTIIPYINTGLTESGPHITQIKTIITKEFNKFFKDKKWLKEKDNNLTGDDIQEGIYIVFNITTPNVGYDAQVKSRVTKIDMSPFSSVLSSNLAIWLNKNEKEIKTIFDKAISARKARDAAKKARDKAREINVKSKKQILLNMPTKLVDCWGKNRLNCELLIVEGDSAANGLIDGRDSEIQAVFPIRGKLIAAYKNTPEKIFANQEVINLIKALGLDLEPKTQKLIYDKKKLRYGKILLCADADPDGANIKNLLIEMFWWLCPDLILNGHIYTTMPPLFRITKNNKYIYLKDEKQLNEYKKAHEGEKYLVNRNKGLGEQNPSELEEALLNPETRNILQLVVSNLKEAEELIDILLGTSVPPRRAFLLEHAEEANEID